MNEHTQIVLFFPQRNIYDPTRFSNALLEVFPELGQPVILPFNIGPAQEDNNIPVAIFNQSGDIQLTLTFNNIVFTLFNDNRRKSSEILNKFFSINEKFNLIFSRIGYVNNVLMPASEVEAFKKEKFKDEEIIQSEEFQLAWFNKIVIDNVKVNYWQRFGTNKSLTKDVFVTYDFNTLVEEKLNVDYAFATHFINSVDSILDI